MNVVGCEVADDIATVTFDDPARRNAWTPAMEEQYFALLDRLAADPQVRAIVVTGEGSSFCPGLDMGALADAASDGLHLGGRRSQHHALTIPKPMVAAVNGPCAGIGLVQALVCDVRFVSRTARLSTAYARRGLPAEYGLSWLLPRMIGTERALDLLLSARVFDGAEAFGLGLASRVCDAADVLPQAQAYAAELARSCSPRAMALIRRQVWGDLSRGYTDANEVWLDAMRGANTPGNPDFAEGVASFRERRPPTFESLPPDWPLPPPPRFAAQ